MKQKCEATPMYAKEQFLNKLISEVTLPETFIKEQTANFKLELSEREIVVATMEI